MGKLFIIPTPIGNLGDMTIRAIEVLKQVRVIAAEDTRVSRKLLAHFGVETPMVPYHEFNKERQGQKVLELLMEGDVALISDAGTPGISDPGYELVQLVLNSDNELEVLPGATAFVPALVASGLPTDSFIFMGFLPKKKSARIKLLEEVVEQKKTLVFYESPYRIGETLTELKEVLGNRRACVAREISKKFEEFCRMSLEAASKFFGEHEVLGEVVILVEGAAKNQSRWSVEEVEKALREGLKNGEKVSSLVREVVEVSGWKKSEVYKKALALNGVFGK